MAQLTEPYPVPEPEDFECWEDWNSAYDELVEDLQRKSHEVDLPGEGEDVDDAELVDLLVRFQGRDSEALYRVVQDDPLTLQHVLVGDACQAPDAHVRGLCREDIVSKVRSHRELLRAPTYLDESIIAGDYGEWPECP